MSESPRSPSHVSGPITVTPWSTREAQEHVYGVKYSPDGNYVAATVSNGSLRVYQDGGNALVQRAKPGPPLDDVPAVAVKWLPRTPNAPYSLAHVSSGGALILWTFEESALTRTARLVEEQNQTNALDIAPDGLVIATGGSDRLIRMYDVETKALLRTYSKGVDDEGSPRPAHVNRIFSVRYVSPTIMLSAGWQSPVQVWDVRTGRAERSVSGAQCGGDGLEPIPNTTRFIAASSRMDHQLQVFDFISSKEVEEESAILSSSLGRHPLSVARLQASTRRLWYFTAQGGIVGLIDIKSGAQVAKATFPQGVLGMEVTQSHPNRAIVCGMRDSIVQLDVSQ